MIQGTGKIFVCYRREDAAGHAGRLYDRLNRRFPGRVFMDVASIGLGTRWAKVIEETLGGCQVAVIMIGKRWLDPGPGGVRRIDETGDPIRTEVSTALRLNLTVVPLLVGGASVPDPDDLPRDIAGITEWQALRLDDEDFDHGTERLIRALAAQVGEPSSEQETVPLPGPPRDQKLKRAGFFGLSIGSFRVWITVGVAAMAVIVVQLGGRFGEGRQTASPSVASPPAAGPSSSADGSTGGGVGSGAPVAAARRGGTAPKDQPPSPKPANPVTAPPVAPPPTAPAPAPVPAPSLAGDYELRSFADATGPLPLRGVMRVVEIAPGRYRYETQVINTVLQLTLFYVGTVEGSAGSYHIITSRTNDPAALVNTPVRTTAQFGGSLLTMVSEFGQRAVWQKR